MQEKIKCFCNEWIIDNVIDVVKGHSVNVSLSATPDNTSLKTFQVEDLKELKQQCYNIITSHLTDAESLNKAMSLFDNLWFLKIEPNIMAIKPYPREEFCGFSVDNNNFAPICGKYKDSYIIHIDIKEDLTITIKLLQVHAE